MPPSLTEAGPKGAGLYFKSPQPGATAQRFNQVAEALAVLSFQPGGVRFLDLHFAAEGMRATWLRQAGQAEEAEETSSANSPEQPASSPGSRDASADAGAPTPPEARP